MLLVTFYFRALDQALRWRESGPIGAKCVTGFMISFILTTRHIRVNNLTFYYRLLFRKRLRVHRSCFGIMEVNKELNYEKTGNEIGWVHQLEQYFKITENDGKNVNVLCLQCLPKKVYLICYMSKCLLYSRLKCRLNNKMVQLRCLSQMMIFLYLLQIHLSKLMKQRRWICS